MKLSYKNDISSIRGAIELSQEKVSHCVDSLSLLLPTRPLFHSAEQQEKEVGDLVFGFLFEVFCEFSTLR